MLLLGEDNSSETPLVMDSLDIIIGSFKLFPGLELFIGYTDRD